MKMKSVNRERISLLVLPIALIYIELMSRVFFFDQMGGIGVIYILLSSCFFGFLMSWLLSFFSETSSYPS